MLNANVVMGTVSANHVKKEGLAHVDVSVSVVRKNVAVLNSFSSIFKVLYFFAFVTNFCHSLNTHINM